MNFFSLLKHDKKPEQIKRDQDIVKHRALQVRQAAAELESLINDTLNRQAGQEVKRND